MVSRFPVTLWRPFILGLGSWPCPIPPPAGPSLDIFKNCFVPIPRLSGTTSSLPSLAREAGRVVNENLPAHEGVIIWEGSKEGDPRAGWTGWQGLKGRCWEGPREGGTEARTEAGSVREVTHEGGESRRVTETQAQGEVREVERRVKGAGGGRWMKMRQAWEAQRQRDPRGYECGKADRSRKTGKKAKTE